MRHSKPNKEVRIDYSLEEKMVIMLMQKALWNTPLSLEEQNINWEGVERIAKAQGVLPFIYGAVTEYKQKIPLEQYKKWRQYILAGALNNEQLLRDQTEVLERLKKANVPCAVLKGTSVSRYYAKPDLRLLGDIDILINCANIEQTDCVLKGLGYMRHTSDDLIHYEYWRANTLVEVHFALMDTPDSCGGRKAEEIAEHCLDDIEIATLADHSFYVLTEPFQAFSLILHMQRHMLISGIGLRQIADWAMYVEKANLGVFKQKTIPMLQKVGLYQYAKVLTKMCVIFLGLDEKKVQWCCDADNDICYGVWRKVLQWGSLGQDDKEGMGNLFTDKKKAGTEEGAPIRNLVSLLTRIACREFPWIKKNRIFLPMAWIYIPVRYIFRSLLGKRPYKNMITVLNNSRESQNLFEKMKLFQIEE